MSDAMLNSPQNGINFSDRDRTIIRLICEDKRHEEIASLLNLSPRTVQSIVYDIRKKIGARSDVGIVMYAVKNGYIDITDPVYNNNQ